MTTKKIKIVPNGRQKTAFYMGLHIAKPIFSLFCKQVYVWDVPSIMGDPVI